jgi:hypothetical protein
VTVSGRFVTLTPKGFAEIEGMTLATTDTGSPDYWAWYAGKLWLYLIPDAAYPVRMSYQQRKSAPVNDADASTIWTNPAACEPLIRACAKRIVARDVMRNYTYAKACEEAEAIALSVLMNEAAQLQDEGGLQPNW